MRARPSCIRGVLAVCALALAAALPVAAQSESDLGDIESDFFGEGEGMVEQEQSPEVAETYTEDLLREEPISFGGSFNLSISAGAGWTSNFPDWTWEYFRDQGKETTSVDLEASLSFSARPAAGLRYYGKATAAYPFSITAAGLESTSAALAASSPTLLGTGIPVPSISIWELFTDVDLGRWAFVRAGKQMVKWGVGYFFQPADIISLSAVDFYDPTAEREGPVAIKMNVPVSVHNLDFYVIAPAGETLDSITKVGLAGRAQLVLGGFELGAGAAYQKTKDWQFIGTVSGSIGSFAVFGEGLLRRKSPGRHIVSADEVLTDRDTWFFGGTAGLTYVNSDAYLTATGQYYFNGEGYSDVRDVADDVPLLLATGQIGIPDILGNTGMHYGGANVSWSIKKDSKVSLSLLWIGNLSDGSGTIRPQSTISLTDAIRLGLSTTFSYGQDKTQFRGLSALGEEFVFPIASVQASVSIGAGKF
jgi:hypothetical protein